MPSFASDIVISPDSPVRSTRKVYNLTIKGSAKCRLLVVLDMKADTATFTNYTQRKKKYSLNALH